MEKNRKDVYLRYIFFSKAFLSIVEATSTLRNFQGADDVSFVRGAASKTVGRKAERQPIINLRFPGSAKSNIGGLAVFASANN